MKKLLTALVAFAFVVSAAPTFAADPDHATTAGATAKPKAAATKKPTKKSAKKAAKTDKTEKTETAPAPAK